MQKLFVFLAHPHERGPPCISSVSWDRHPCRTIVTRTPDLPRISTVTQRPVWLLPLPPALPLASYLLSQLAYPWPPKGPTRWSFRPPRGNRNQKRPQALNSKQCCNYFNNNFKLYNLTTTETAPEKLEKFGLHLSTDTTSDWGDMNICWQSVTL